MSATGIAKEQTWPPGKCSKTALSRCCPDGLNSSADGIACDSTGSEMNDPDETVIITPGGPRPRSSATRVPQGSVVEQREDGSFVVNPPVSSEVTVNPRDHHMPQLVLTPGGYKSADLVHHVESGSVLDSRFCIPVRARLTSVLGDRPAVHPRQSPAIPAGTAGPACAVRSGRIDPRSAAPACRSRPAIDQGLRLGTRPRQTILSPHNSGSSNGGRATCWTATPPDHELLLEF